MRESPIPGVVWHDVKHINIFEEKWIFLRIQYFMPRGGLHGGLTYGRDMLERRIPCHLLGLGIKNDY